MRPHNRKRNDCGLAFQLYEAVEERNFQLMTTLLHRDKADPNFILPEKGISAFHLVIGSDSIKFSEEATRVFLQHCGNPNVRSDDGLTPVHVAAVWGRTSLLLLLLACGGDPWLRDTEYDQTPLHMALKEEQWEAALLLQRFQLLDRRSRHSEARNVPHFSLKLEKVTVSTGEFQAEYGTAVQDAERPLNDTPMLDKKKNNVCGWNIEPVTTQDYVSEWCQKEFSPRPVTSTPRPTSTVPCNNNGTRSANIDSPAQCVNYSSNTTVPIGTSPAPVNYTTDTNNTPVRPTPQKFTPKNNSDVRKNLFLELKKRLSGFKQSFENSRDESEKNGEFDRRGKLGYFSKRKKACKVNRTDENDNKRDNLPVIDNENENVDGKTPTVDSYTHKLAKELDTSTEYREAVGSVGTDEVDAVPFPSPTDLSVEWIASQSCFSEHHSPDTTNSQAYFTCDEGSGEMKQSTNTSSSTCGEKSTVLISEPVPVSMAPSSSPLTLTSEDCVFKVPQRPPRRKQLAALNTSYKTASSDGQSATTFCSVISEEYRYTDNDEGVVLLETRVLATSVEVPGLSDCESVVSVPRSGTSDAATAVSEVSSIPASFAYDSVTLRKELVARGEQVGPITSSTKRVYLRRLYRLQKNPVLCTAQSSIPYTPELRHVLYSIDWEAEVITYASLETIMSGPFERPDPSRRWREGVAKSSFNYLLLDPRISCNLPASVTEYDQATWQQFISSVFYVGKGKRSRPYAHLYQAVRVWNKGRVLDCPNAKVTRIMDIWRAGQGVVCLHVYQNVIPVEAYTREAAMIDVIGLQNLVNIKSGEYYGPAATWRIRQKRRLGAYLLYRAMRIFLSEGERQLRPGDID